MNRFLKIVFMLYCCSVTLLSGARPTNVIGFDDMSCGAWAASEATPLHRDTYVFWIRGFLSGHNYANQAHQTPVVSNSTIVLYVDKYCKENPLNQFAGAAFKLSDELAQRSRPLNE